MQGDRKMKEIAYLMIVFVAGWMMGVIHRKDEQNDRSNPE
jgi:hypothetical protein